MTSVLVTGANGDIADAVGRIVKSWRSDVVVDGADCQGVMPAAGTFSHVHTIPKAWDRPGDFVAALEVIQKERHYDCIIPCPEPELRALVEFDGSISGLPLLMNHPSVVRTFLSKLATAEWLHANSVSAPETWLLSDAPDEALPLFVKPVSGWGSSGLEVVRTVERLHVLRNARGPEFVAQRLLDERADEYTCAVSRAAGTVNVLAMRRELQGGHSRMVEILENPRLDELLREISSKFNFDHFLNVQLKLCDGVPYVFEINPRFSSTSMMRHLLGFSDVTWALDAREGIAPSTPSIQTGSRVYRQSREVVFNASGLIRR